MSEEKEWPGPTVAEVAAVHAPEVCEHRFVFLRQDRYEPYGVPETTGGNWVAYAGQRACNVFYCERCCEVRRMAE